MGALGLLVAFQTLAGGKLTLDIPAQDLGSALKAFSAAANEQVLFSDSLVAGRRSVALKGEYTSESALATLLRGSDLKADRTKSGVLLIRPIAYVTEGSAQSSDESFNSASLPDRLRLAQAGGATSQSASVVSGSAEVTGTQTAPGLEEVVVTAQKRAERLQDVPVPVTSIAADTLVESNLTRIQDYYTMVPGLNVTPNDYGTAQVTIRGLTTGGYTNPTVGVVVDDVPFGASSYLVLGEEVPDFDPSDLARIEVLRGPQGTFYGASSIGGLLKFVTVDPSTAGFSGHIQAGLAGVHNGDGLGYNVRGSLNAPLAETLALRLSAFTRLDPGYIDDPALHERGVNKGEVSGGHLSLLWRPSDGLSLKVNALFQHTNVDGSPEVDIKTGLGDLQQDDARDTGLTHKTFQAYSATVNAKLGTASLAFVSGYSIDRFSGLYDYTQGLGTLSEADFGVSGAPFLDQYRTTRFTQELRLSVPFGTRVDWLLGGFHDHQHSMYSVDYLASNYYTGEVVGAGLMFTSPWSYDESAAFTDVTVHVTRQLDIQFGARESHNRQTYQENFNGEYTPAFYGAPSPLTYSGPATSENSFTYLVTPQLKLSPDLMLYARLASGYRPGGPNLGVSGAPATYSPDTTKNYEMGVKGDILDRKVTFDASLYYIRWNNVQLQLRAPISESVYAGNGGEAKSQGVEIALEARPILGFKVSAWAAINQAVLTQTLPLTSTVYGLAGDRLPDSSRFSGNIALDDEFQVWGNVRGFAGGTVSYVGDREGVFVTGPQRQDLAAYTKTDLRLGLKYESWTSNLFVNNVMDRRGVLSGGVGTLNPIAFSYIQPRTVGISFNKDF